MKVSFVIPVYKKKPEQLQNCLKSLKDQSYDDIEVVGVFDGPDEKLENVFKTFISDPRFKYKVIEHGGAPKARNSGFEDTTGHVVSFWDADCIAEPHMTREWIRTFKDNPDCEFVYSGYKWTDPTVPGFESEAFDPWVLEKYNYISTMFPLVRECFPGWDESLTGLQDWDYWRRVVKSGCKGRFIPGFGFSTDLPDKDSISGDRNKIVERVQKIREKHEDVKRDILVYSAMYKREAIQVAKLLDADYFHNPGFYKIHDYKMILMVGFHPIEAVARPSFFSTQPEGTVKVIYWLGSDAESLYVGPYHDVKKLVPEIKNSVTKNLCDSRRTDDILKDLDLESEILVFPREEGIPCAAFPEKFRILALADADFRPYLMSVIKALPNIDIDVVAAETRYECEDYTAAIQLTRYPRLIGASRNMIMNGRYMLSNVQEPYAGYIDTSNVTKFKEEMIKAIMELKDKKELNVEGQNYYLGMTSREEFRDKVYSLMTKKVEVI